MSGTRPQELRLLWIPFEMVCRHPVIDVSNAVFKLRNSRSVVTGTTQIQLHVIGVRMIIHGVFLGFLFEISSVHNEQRRPEYQSLWDGARNMNDA